MKTFERKIDIYRRQKLFKPVRSAKEYCELVLEVTELLLTHDEALLFASHEERTYPFLKLQICCYNRFFLYEDEGHFCSYQYPFTVEEDPYDSVPIIRMNNFCEVDFQMTSYARSLLSIMRGDVLIDAIYCEDSSQSIPYDTYILVEHVMNCEPAHIRYDKDEEHENGSLHPLHHLDVNHSQGGTFKIGLNAPIGSDSFEEFVDNDKERRYIIF